MKLKLNIFLQIMTGSWVSQKTTYFLKTNKVHCSQFQYMIDLGNCLTFRDKLDKLNHGHYNLQYYKNNRKQENNYSFTYTCESDLGLIKRKTNKSLDNYQYSIHKNDYLIVKQIVNNVEYIEYIYKINNTFITSIAFLKKSGKYIAISCSSSIKIKALNPN